MGSCPEASDLKQDEGYSVCVCVSRGGRGRRQHPGRTFGTLFPAALATLLLRLHKSLPAGSMLLLSGDSHFFPRPCPASSDSLPCQMTQGSAIASLICPFPGLWYSIHVPCPCLSPTVLSDVHCSLHLLGQLNDVLSHSN